MIINSNMRYRVSLSLALCLVLTVALAACGESAIPTPDAEPKTETPTSTPTPALLVPTPTPVAGDFLPNVTWYVPPSLEEQIYRSVVIVRASLLSATAGTETIPSTDEGIASTYRPVQELRFTAHEYLKGAGPNEVVVVVRGDHTYLTEAEARKDADFSISARNTTWDTRQGVLFLTSGQIASAAEGSQLVQTLAFTRSNPLESAWDYTVDNLSRAWLPAADGEPTGQSSDSTSQSAESEFIADGAETPPPVISLAELKAGIAEMEATLKAGEGIEGYERCIRSKILRERINRADPMSPLQLGKALPSGSAAGTEVYKGENTYQEPKYNRYWLSGPDADLFKAVIIDADSSSSSGYDHMLATARPLPFGTYRVFYNVQSYLKFPCNFVPDDAYSDWTVTVASPEGTIHEAIFDPVVIGTGVGTDASNGNLSPTSFTVSGSSAELEGLIWEDGRVTLTLSSYASLSGQVLHFIELDGTLSLSLGVADAIVDEAMGTLAWSLASQPWQDGDLLMLRIRDAE